MRETPIPIERDEHVLRARRTAAATRIFLGALGIGLLIADPGLLPEAAYGIAGFAVILLTSIVQLTSRVSVLRVEESLAGAAAILIVGLGQEWVNVLSVLWMVAVATGVMARGGRVHWIGRTVVLGALAMPVVLNGSASVEYAAFAGAVVGLQLTSGRLTRELNRLLRAARLDAENAETLLLAGDIAARVSERIEAEARPPLPARQGALSDEEERNARAALAKLIEGEGLAIALQPIVDVSTGTIHAYEALARFRRRRSDRSPLHWFALAEELGRRTALERACLRASLTHWAKRPPGSRVSVNLSVAALLEPETAELIDAAGRSQANDLEGLIVEITEETLVSSEVTVGGAIDALRARGALLAVDDIGAGYSGLRQITAVVPDYLKLDRSLVAGIDGDDDRAALVRALASYAGQVGGQLVAEGVERRPELNRLRELGVPLVQGFYLAAPEKPWPAVGAAAIEALGAAGHSPGDDARRALQPA